MDKLQRWTERIGPYLLAIILTTVWYYRLHQTFPNPASALLGAAVTAAAVLVGFLATAKAMVLTMASSDVFKSLKIHGYTDLLFDYMAEALWGAITLLIFSTAGFFLENNQFSLPKWFTIFWVFLSILSISLFVRITNLLFKLLRRA